MSRLTRRAARVADLDEARALELGQAEADRRLRDAEPLCEVALHERRSLRQLPADDQLAQRLRDAVLDRSRAAIGPTLLSASVMPVYGRAHGFEISYRKPYLG